MRRHSLLTSCLASVLAGCVGNVQLPPATVAAGSPGVGRVFGSIGVSSDAPTVDFSSIQFRPASADRTRRQGEFLFYSPVGVMGAVLSLVYRTPVDFRDATAHGTVFVATLPAGDYELVSIMVGNAPMGGWAAHFYEADAGAVPFRVEAGGLAYLGRFVSHLRMGRDAHRVPEVQGAFFTVSSRLADDLAVVKARGEAQAGDSVVDFAPRMMQADNAALRPAAP